MRNKDEGFATDPYLATIGEDGDGRDCYGVAPYRPPHCQTEDDGAVPDPERRLIVVEEAARGLAIACERAAKKNESMRTTLVAYYLMRAA
ncbi:MAG: hypothetical protein V1723_04130 [Candidatus Uhrbacteria bacterium]